MEVFGWSINSSFCCQCQYQYQVFWDSRRTTELPGLVGGYVMGGRPRRCGP